MATRSATMICRNLGLVRFLGPSLMAPIILESSKHSQMKTVTMHQLPGSDASMRRSPRRRQALMRRARGKDEGRAVLRCLVWFFKPKVFEAARDYIHDFDIPNDSVQPCRTARLSRCTQDMATREAARHKEIFPDKECSSKISLPQLLFRVSADFHDRTAIH